MRFIFRKYFIIFAALCLSMGSLNAQNFVNRGPQPGDKYKEFYLSMGIGSALNGNEWRVTDPNVNINAYPAAAAFLPNPILEINLDDLTDATRAEFVLDIWEGHPGTTDKEFRVNGNDWIPVPELVTTPSNPSYYMSQRNAIVEVPLSDFVSGSTNTIEGNSGPQAGPYSFGWGQWGWYGIVVRVYYATTSTDYAGTISINGSGSGTTFNDDPNVSFTPNLVTNPERVDFIAYYEGYDVDGDGFYKDWQREYHRDSNQPDIVIDNIVGKATTSPYSLTWDTDWVPDQEQDSIKLIARVKGTDGFWYVTDKVENLTLERDAISIKMFKPSGVPERYWVRGSSIGSSKSHTINIPSSYNLSVATSALMLTSTWNGSDKGGLPYSALFNGNGLADHGLNNYYKYDEVNVPVGYLQLGDNTVTYQSDESEEHGIEVNWPGSGLYVKFDYSLIPPEPQIDIWFGDNQKFGHLGNPQRWVNILGNVTDPDGISSLTYKLNGGAANTLNTGPDTRRLLSQGDFNVEIDTADLNPGLNTVEITAEDNQNFISTRTVNFDYTPNIRWQKYYSIDWDTVTNLQNVIQVVDGNWKVENGYLKNIGLGYDRSFAIGDVAWDDYEAEFSFIIHEHNGTYVYPSFGPAIGYLFRWTGHTDNRYPGFQPKAGFEPYGALGWHNFINEFGNQKFQIFGNDLTLGAEDSVFAVPLDTEYRMKMVVRTDGSGIGVYKLKYWAASDPEPDWILTATAINGAADPAKGAILFIIHQMKVSIGDITVKPIVTYTDAVEVEVIPNRYELYQNYPNPFNPSTTIRFSLRETQDVKIVIFDQLGQEVRTIVNQKFDAGYHEFEFNASGIASGVYFYRIITGDFVNVKKMMLLK